MNARPNDGRLTAAAAGRDPVIRVRGLTAGYGGTNVLENLDLDVYRGEILGVVGASGTGKTVLLRAILGLIPRAPLLFILSASTSPGRATPRTRRSTGASA
jgi:phospholipid/cholesterol/gamma-HCH transport system ATP-binding protein